MTGPEFGRAGWVERFGRWPADERVRFVVVGGWNTAFGYLAFVVLYALLHDRLNYLVIGALAHALSVTNAFVCHRMLVFRSRDPWFAEFVRFNLAQAAVLACGLAGLWFLVSVLHVSPLIGQAIVTVLGVVLSYLAHRRFTFGG